MVKHFHVEFTEMPEKSSGMATASVKYCMACGRFLSGMGGGSTFICEPCLDALQRMPWKGNLRKLRDLPKTLLCDFAETLQDFD